MCREIGPIVPRMDAAIWVAPAGGGGASAGVAIMARGSAIDATACFAGRASADRVVGFFKSEEVGADATATGDDRPLALRFVRDTCPRAIPPEVGKGVETAARRQTRQVDAAVSQQSWQA